MENPVKAELNVPRSPYAIFENEAVKVEDPKPAITEGELRYLLRNNFIREKERAILNAVSRFKLMNIKQISDWLALNNMSLGKTTLEAILKKLAAKEFISRIMIVRKDTSIVRYEYILGRSAVFMPEYEEQELINPLSITMADIKSMLAANQFIISVLKRNRTLNFAAGGVIKTQGSIFSPSRSFYYDAMVELDCNTLYAIIVRRSEGWEAAIEAVIPACKQVLKENRSVRIIVICEDMEHKAQLEHTMRNLSVTVVHDRELHQQGLEGIALI